MPQLSFHSPYGDLTLTEEDGALVALDWGWSPMQASTPLLAEARRQLDAFFDGGRRAFDLPLQPRGTPFQLAVWRALLTIPFGKTITYGALATMLHTAPRAIGHACGRNPLPVLIPCHRVLASDRTLGGYSGDGGVETKRALLTLESASPVTARPVSDRISAAA